jgi:oligoendopeptidase F
VKGTTATLNSRRGWRSTLERSTRQNRLSDTTLTTLLSEMRRALPLFRRYLLAKAKYLGLPRLSFYDLFAPAGDSGPHWTFDAAVAYIEEKLGEFDEELGSFVRTARDHRWIDAQPRSAKVGGAYSIDFPLARESRILANFDGSYDGVSTLAHELGHAWHSHLIFDLPPSQRQYPMTLAETASIFNETLLFYRTLEETETVPRRLYILEQFLQNATQIIVDILSRFEFESTVMERRTDRELPAAELCEAMLAAQKATYGDALNPEELHPYMWAGKGPYYRADLAFYNFPYAFGELFGLGLYGQFEENPGEFRLRYRALLRETGRNQAAAVAAGVGFDIESPGFWRGAVDRIEGMVREFETAAQNAGH